MHQLQSLAAMLALVHFLELIHGVNTYEKNIRVIRVEILYQIILFQPLNQKMICLTVEVLQLMPTIFITSTLDL